MNRLFIAGLLAFIAFPAIAADPVGIKIDKDKKSVSIDAKSHRGSSPNTTRSTRSSRRVLARSEGQESPRDDRDH